MNLLGSTSGPESGHVRAILVIGGLLGAVVLEGMFAWAWLFNGNDAAKDPAMIGFAFLTGVVTAMMNFYTGARTVDQTRSQTAHDTTAMLAQVAPPPPTMPAHGHAQPPMGNV